jgi:hypothetical protein
MMNKTIYSLVHGTCGHTVANSLQLDLIEWYQAHLVIAGYHAWQIRTSRWDDSALQRTFPAGRCDTCFLDPARVALLLNAHGDCRICFPRPRSPEIPLPRRAAW